jgi:hypothetical protein
MIRIDSDTHFTPLDAFAGLDLKYASRDRTSSPCPRAVIGSTIRRAHRTCQRTSNRCASNPLRSELARL